MSFIKTMSSLGIARSGWALLLAVLVAGFPSPASAENELGTTAQVARQPLQELVRKKRPKGQIYVTIPQARVFGEGSGYRAYCSPQIRAINASDKTVEELITGINYVAPNGKMVGSTVTRFFRVKVGKQETHYFYSTLEANYCNGLSGEMEIVRCIYENGADCTDDVRAVAYGAVPMKLTEKNKGNK